MGTSRAFCIETGCFLLILPLATWWLTRLSGFDPIDNFFRVVSSEFPKRREPEMGLNGL